MASKKPKEIQQALEKKGFVKKEGDHHFYFFTDKEGKITPNIKTKISHNKKKEYGDNLLSMIQKQLKLETKKELLNLIECSLSEDEYREILRKKYPNKNY